MNPFNDISLVMFSTTIGHHGYKTYDLTLNHTDKLIGLNNFANRSVAIKVHNDQLDEYAKMSESYRDFNILKEIADNKLAENPHSSVDSYTPYIIGNYCISIANIYSLLPLKSKYTMWLEDDCLIYCDENFPEYIIKTIAYLEDNLNVFSIHMNGPHNGIDSDELFVSGKYSFRPQIFRTIEMYNVAQVFKANIDKLVGMHPEMSYENLIKYIYPNKYFMEFNHKKVWHEHLGQSDFLDIKQRLKL